MWEISPLKVTLRFLGKEMDKNICLTIIPGKSGEQQRMEMWKASCFPEQNKLPPFLLPQPSSCHPHCDLLLLSPLGSSSSLLTCQWWQMALRSWDSLRGVSMLERKGWAAGGREIFQGSLLLGSSTATSATLTPPGILDRKRSGKLLAVNWLLKTENRTNIAARSDHSIFPHCAFDRFTYTWHDTCLQLAELYSQGEGGGRAKWDK